MAEKVTVILIFDVESFITTALTPAQPVAGIVVGFTLINKAVP
jgi:hypothetical protein